MPLEAFQGGLPAIRPQSLPGTAIQGRINASLRFQVGQLRRQKVMERGIRKGTHVTTLFK